MYNTCFVHVNIRMAWIIPIAPYTKLMWITHARARALWARSRDFQLGSAVIHRLLPPGFKTRPDWALKDVSPFSRLATKRQRFARSEFKSPDISSASKQLGPLRNVLCPSANHAPTSTISICAPFRRPIMLFCLRDTLKTVPDVNPTTGLDDAYNSGV